MGATHSFFRSLVWQSTTFFVLWPMHALLIWSEERIWNKLLGFRLSMPRSMVEVRAHPSEFMKVLQRHGVVSSRAEFISMSSLADIEAEPEKNATAGGIELVHFEPSNNEQKCGESR
jgi:hypothetical protein